MAFKVRGFAALAATGILGLGTLVGAPAASAADLGNMVIDCGEVEEGVPTNVTGNVGETFTLQDDPDTDKDCTSVASTTAGIVTWSATPGGTDDPTTLTNNTALHFTLLAPGTTTLSYELGDMAETPQSFTITVTEGTSSGGSSGPVMQLQQLPIPASGNCSDADPNNALWAKTNTTPWTLQWGEWSEPVPFSGFVCGRWVWAYGTP